jgi:hypothetical protein
MSDIMQARKALIARILEGDGRASPAQRCAAFDNRGLAEAQCRLYAGFRGEPPVFHAETSV